MNEDDKKEMAEDYLDGPILDAAGASFADILKVTVFLLDVDDRAVMGLWLK